jgi:hypothetical protein
LLAATGKAGFRGYTANVTKNGASIRLLPVGSGVPVPGPGIVVLWIVELGILVAAAFARLD